jgi:hypothetical protein
MGNLLHLWRNRAYRDIISLVCNPHDHCHLTYMFSHFAERTYRISDSSLL